MTNYLCHLCSQSCIQHSPFSGIACIVSGRLKFLLLCLCLFLFPFTLAYAGEFDLDFAGYEQKTSSSAPELNFRFNIKFLETSAKLPPNVVSYRMEEKEEAPVIIVSKRFSKLYAFIPPVLAVYEIDGSDLLSIRPKRLVINGATDKFGIDETSNRMVFLRADGKIAIYKLDEQGFLETENFNVFENEEYYTSFMHVSSSTHIIYLLTNSCFFDVPNAYTCVAGIPTSAPPVGGAVCVNYDFKKIYVGNGELHNRRNLIMYELTGRNGIDENTMKEFRDGIFPRDDSINAYVTDIAFNSEQNKLYVCGHLKDNKDCSPLVVYEISPENGEITGEPKAYSSDIKNINNPRIAYFPEKKKLYLSSANSPIVNIYTIGETGYPTEEVVSAKVGNSGKNSIALSPQGNFIYFGADNSTVLGMNLDPNGMPYNAIIPYISMLNKKPNPIKPRETSQWYNIDEFFKNKTTGKKGSTTCYFTLGDLPIKKMEVQFDFALMNEKDEPIREKTFLQECLGGTVAFIVPYLSSDVDERINGVAPPHAEAKKHFDASKAIKTKQPKTAVSLDFSLVMACVKTIEGEFAGLNNLGFNAVNLTGHPFPEDKVKSVFSRNGITCRKLNLSDMLDPFPSEINSGTEKELARRTNEHKNTCPSFLLYVSNSPHFSHSDTERTAGLQAQEEFRNYLKDISLLPKDFDMGTWAEVRITQKTNAKRTATKKLYYHTARFLSAKANSIIEDFALKSKKILPGSAVCCVINKLPNVFLIPEQGKDFLQTVGDCNGFPLYYKLGQNKKIDYFIADDLPDQTGSFLSYYYENFKNLNKNYDAKLGVIINSDERQNNPKTIKLKAYSALMRKFSLYDFGNFGPKYVANSGWSDEYDRYPCISEIIKNIGAVEDIVAKCRFKDAEIAVLVPTSSSLWDENGLPHSYSMEAYYIYTVLRHEGYNTDIVTSNEITENLLSKYKLIYITEPNIEESVQNVFSKWVNNGGMLYSMADAGTMNEHNEPSPILENLKGCVVKQQNRTFFVTLDNLKEAGSVSVPEALISDVKPKSPGAKVSIPVIGAKWDITLKGQKAKAIAFFSDTKPAMVFSESGRGKILTSGVYFGHSYFRGQEKENSGKMISVLCRLAKIKKLMHSSVPELETIVLESGTQAVVGIFNWAKPAQEGAEVSVLFDKTPKKITDAKGKNINFTMENEYVKIKLDIDDAELLIAYY